MGNTDSHSSSASPARSSCSLRFSSRREEVPSARSWWSRSRGRGPPRGGSRPGAGSPQRHIRGEQRDGTSLESGGSPKVLLSKDGSMRVEFTNARVVPVEPQGPAGLPGPPAATVPEPSLRTSKGSSLSSDGSWYDSPWGTSVFICGGSEADGGGAYNAVFSAPVDVSPGFNSGLLFPTAGYNTCSSGRTEDSGIGDSVILQPDLVCSSHNTPPAFPTAPDATALLGDGVPEEEGPGGAVEQRYSSLTLPCRRADPSTSSASRKDFLKSRIQRLSDWTGSLSRKRRRLQVRK